MKFKGSKDSTGVSVGGQYFPAKKGVIEVPDNGDYASLLAPHGFKPVSDDESAKSAGSNKDAGADGGNGSDGGSGDSGSGDGSQGSGQDGGDASGDAGGAAK
jgi:hypothetical protein